MIVREYCQADQPELERLHRTQGFQYPFPNLSDPLFFVKLVGEEEGQIVNAGIAHLTAEIFFLSDPTHGTPRQRYENFLTMHEAGCKTARIPGGLADLHCWVPPEIGKSFGRRLMRLGWKRPLWTSYAKELE